MKKMSYLFTLIVVLFMYGCGANDDINKKKVKVSDFEITLSDEGLFCVKDMLIASNNTFAVIGTGIKSVGSGFEDSLIEYNFDGEKIRKTNLEVSDHVDYGWEAENTTYSSFAEDNGTYAFVGTQRLSHTSSYGSANVNVAKILTINTSNRDKKVFTLDVTQGTYLSDIKAVDDGYIVIGQRVSYTKSTNGRRISAIIFKIDKELEDIKWIKNYRGSNIAGFKKLAILENSDIVVAGFTETSKNGTQGLLVKYSSDGESIWSKEFGGSGYDRFFDLKSDGDNLIAVGESNSNDIGINTEVYHGIIVKFNANGESQWVNGIDIGERSEFHNLVVTPRGYIVWGSTVIRDEGLSDEEREEILQQGLLVKYNKDGNEEWHSVRDGNNTGISSIVITPSGNYLMAHVKDDTPSISIYYEEELKDLNGEMQPS